MKYLAFIVLVILVFLSIFYFSKMPTNQTQVSEITVTSSAFKNGEAIPATYSCDGKGQNPPINISGVSSTTKSLILWMHDPDAPSGRFDHWILYNLPVGTTNLSEGFQRPGDMLGMDYVPPCPHSGTHHYVFTVYGVSEAFYPHSAGKWSEVESWILEHMTQKGELVGVYTKSTSK